MTGLTGLFKAPVEEVDNSDKLVDLFRNRVELKKEFAELRNEKYQLLDRIKQHEGATARVQQKMDHLESLLLDREWVHNVVAFYQLRRLAAHCNVKLARFAEQLKQQREQKIHSKVLVEWDAARNAEAAVLEKQISEHRLQVQLLEDQLLAARHDLATMGGVGKILKGKQHQQSIDEIVANIEAGERREEAYLQSLDEIHKREAPAHSGLDVAAKRSINFMILSYAQHLYLHFEEDNLAAMAKEASEKSVGAVNYGNKQDCDRLIKRLESRWGLVESSTEYTKVLQKRAKKIAEHAMFRSDDDVVPSPGTVATVFMIDANGVIREKDANILGDNYFGIAKVLSR